jgi:hypothetical protein
VLGESVSDDLRLVNDYLRYLADLAARGHP